MTLTESPLINDKHPDDDVHPSGEYQQLSYSIATIAVQSTLWQSGRTSTYEPRGACSQTDTQSLLLL